MKLWIVVPLLGLAACPKPGQSSQAPLPPDPVDNRITAPPPPVEHLVPVVDEVRAPRAADLGDLGTSEPTAVIETNLGTLHCLLATGAAPATVANFIGLATGAKAWRDPDSGEVRRGVPLYNGLGFHRVIPDFMIQGGDPLGEGTGGPGYSFDDEIAPDVHFDQPGILAMANAGPGTNGSQFFITAKATPWLDGHHTIFGKCLEVDLVNQITLVPRDDRDRPEDPVVIRSITFTR